MGFFKRNKIKKESKKNITTKSSENDSKDVQKTSNKNKTVGSATLDTTKNATVKQASKSPAKPAAKKTQNNKQAKITPASSNDLANQKTPTNTYYLTTRVENNKKVGWEIKRGNAAKVSVIVPTKEAAKLKVKELAKNSKANVIVYRINGTVEETYRINDK